jgi:hypothetical protein
MIDTIVFWRVCSPFTGQVVTCEALKAGSALELRASWAGERLAGERFTGVDSPRQLEACAARWKLALVEHGFSTVR